MSQNQGNTQDAVMQLHTLAFMYDVRVISYEACQEIHMSCERSASHTIANLNEQNIRPVTVITSPPFLFEDRAEHLQSFAKEAWQLSKSLLKIPLHMMALMEICMKPEECTLCQWTFELMDFDPQQLSKMISFWTDRDEMIDAAGGFEHYLQYMSYEHNHSTKEQKLRESL